MATYLVFHEVEDVEHWRNSPVREQLFGPAGIKVRPFYDPEGSNRVGLIFEIDDLDAFQAMLNSPQGQQAMKHDGVRPETILMLAES
jgi:antibiotic biosynthesis monooxygenase (ABM) superfamily enzyme